MEDEGAGVRVHPSQGPVQMTYVPAVLAEELGSAEWALAWVACYEVENGNGNGQVLVCIISGSRLFQMGHV